MHTFLSQKGTAFVYTPLNTAGARGTAKSKRALTTKCVTEKRFIIHFVVASAVYRQAHVPVHRIRTVDISKRATSKGSGKHGQPTHCINQGTAMNDPLAASRTALVGEDLNHDTLIDDPLAASRMALAGEDLKYWLAHPELPALISHFMAKSKNRLRLGMVPAVCVIPSTS